MSKSNKFGTFAGVYTPSLLTILGVIMYMRLGWVVGEAGLYAALAIIILSHVISVTTGLSISSIATDKKIYTGGIYYLLSRSLGFPMGGAIGITLFIGTALSIALYIIGFSESFLGIPSISDTLNLEPGINSYRIVGSAVLIFLVILAFISTSLALQSQFFILGAIALSLVSIFIGIFTNHDFSTAVVPHSGGSSEVSLVTIFAIFFPAVTGFTAGVAMSGDLKDSKKSIPKGTMLAILTGLLVYVGLAVVFGLMVDKDLLINDKNFLLKIAWWSPLVIAGIWGATLSSALGGILGGPRIVQAIAMDKIVPAFLGKGVGESNEPRNALIFTFLIAEMGILIGELDAIAEIVSMFYIAAYGFINLAFSLESWASTDFRPTFKISKWIGVIGFIASFGVMFQLNPAAMLIAFVIMWLIYFVLKRKEIKSESGDVWASVWTSIARTSLTRLQKKEMEERNWKPNILLFGNNKETKKHLVNLGKAFVGKYGFLSIFNFKESKENEFLFTKQEQIIETEDSASNKAIFERQYCTDNIYKSIAQIAAMHGFAGIEPNTVLLEWASNSKNPVEFTALIKKINQLDMNILVMDYDPIHKFGNRQRIDIWWRGSGQNGNLSLQLLKFLLLDERWSNAKIRLMIVNPINANHEIIHKTAMEVLTNMRIDAEIKVINNQYEERPFNEILQTESVDTNLIFMGLPEIEDGQEQEFVEGIQNLTFNVGSFFLVKASSFFKTLKIGSYNNVENEDSIQKIIVETKERETEFSIQNQDLKLFSAQLVEKLMDTGKIVTEHFLKLANISEPIENQIKKEVEKALINIEFINKNSSSENFTNKIIAAEGKALSRINALFQGNKAEDLKLYHDQIAIILDDFIKITIQNIEKFIDNLPTKIKIKYSIDELKINENDSVILASYKKRKQRLARLGIKSFKNTVRVKRISQQILFKEFLLFLDEILNEFAICQYKKIIEIQNFTNELHQGFLSISNGNYENREAIFKTEFLKLTKKINSVFSIFNEDKTRIANQTAHLTETIHTILIATLSKPNANSLIDEEINLVKLRKKLKTKYSDLNKNLVQNMNMLANQVILSNTLQVAQNRIKSDSIAIKKLIYNGLNQNLSKPREIIAKSVLDYMEQKKESKSSNFSPDLSIITNPQLTYFTHEIITKLQKKSKSWLDNIVTEVEILNEESLNTLTNTPYQGSISSKIAIRQMIDYITQMEYSEPVLNIINELPKQITELNKKLCDQIRLIGYTLSHDNELLSDESIEMQNNEPKINIQNFKKEVRKSDTVILESGLKIDAATNGAIDKLGVYPFIKSTQNIKAYIKQKRESNRANFITNHWNRVKLWIQDQYAKLLFVQSSGIILTKNLIEGEKQLSLTERLLDQYRRTHINKNEYSKIPFYYKHLFLKKQNYSYEFLVGREVEINKIENYIQNYKNGFFGALLITGQRHCGKSFMVNIMADKYFDRTKVHFIQPPESGSTKYSDFDNSFSQAMDNSLSAEANMENLERGSLVVLEDLELWWSRAEGGLDTIKKILSLIQKYKSKLYFTATINNLAYKIINQLITLERSFIGVVECGPMNAGHLYELVIKRHESADLEFELNGKNQKHFRTWNYAHLFNRYFNYSNGNPGLCLHAWINNIVQIDDHTIKIRNPKVFDNQIFIDLELIYKVILLQLVIHSAADLQKLSLLINEDEPTTLAHLSDLKQMGLVIQTEDLIYKTDRINHHRIVDFFEINNLI